MYYAPAPYPLPNPPSVGASALVGGVGGLVAGGLVGTLLTPEGADTSMGGTPLLGALVGGALGLVGGIVYAKRR